MISLMSTDISSFPQKREPRVARAQSPALDPRFRGGDAMEREEMP